MQVPTSDQLRHDIDSGGTGDKVAASDPAAAPLGTDAEAGGAPPTVAERAMAAKQPRQSSRDRAHPPSGIAIYLALVLGVGIALILVLSLAQA